MMRLWNRRGSAAGGRASFTVLQDRFIDQPEADDLEDMLAVSLALREAESREGVRAAKEILAAAAERDARADARDAAADKRDQDLDLAALLGARDYGGDWPARRAAALDRENAKQDRTAARLDLSALADQFFLRENLREETSGGRPWGLPGGPRETVE